MADNDKTGRGPRGPRSGDAARRQGGDKPAGGRGSGDKDSAGRSQGARPSYAKPFGGKSFGEKPTGEKPEGRRFSKPAGEGDGTAKPLRSHGYRDRPGVGSNRPAGTEDGKPVSRGYRDKPGGSGGTRDKKPFTPRESRDRGSGGAEPKVAATRDPIGWERIAKRLARAGVSSRRDAEALIANGRVTVNGRVLTSPAVNVREKDDILLDGKPIPQIERTRLWLFNKPSGLVTSNRDPEGRPTIFDRLPTDLPRVITVGRLDITTEGLLLLTNDGGLARTLELPQTGWLRRYRVRAHGKVTQERLTELKDGIAVDGVFYGAIEAIIEREQGSNVWLEIGLREGKNREVKNVLGAIGLDVNRLIRISYGPFQLGALEEGAVMEIKGKTLQEQLGERLIDEAGVNFDAPILRSFPNRPVRKDEEPSQPMTAEKRGDWVSGTRDPRAKPGASGGARPRRMKPDEKREEARDRLTTKKPEAPAKRRDDARDSKAKRGERSKDKNAERDAKWVPERAARGANVWMAPGARPMGKGRAEREEKARAEAPRSSGPRSRSSGDGPARPRAPGDKPARSGAPRGPRTPRPPRKD